MIKQISITFDFNTETEEVTNIKTTGSVEKVAKKTTTKKVKEVIEEMANESIITLESNKLVFNNKAVAEMELKHEDRIVIEWQKEEGRKKLIPIIRKDDEAGNKVTKTNTVTYKGKANTVLAQYGTEFTLLLLEEGVWKLVATMGADSMETLEDVIEQSEETEPMLLVDTDEVEDIEEMTFTL